MFPQCHERFHTTDHFGDGIDHSLPDAAQVAKIEDVVKFSRSGQHFNLSKYNMQILLV